MLKDKKEINKNLNRHENIYILLSNLKFIISPYFYPESTNENIYFGRSSDLSGYEAFPFNFEQWHGDSQQQNGLYSCGYSSGFSPDSLFFPHLETKTQGKDINNDRKNKKRQVQK